jgi:hypothetical protein
MPFSRQTPVEQHLHGRVVVPAGEHFPVVGQDLLRYAVGTHRLGEPVADPWCGLADHQIGRDAVPGVVVDPGQRLGAAAVGEQEPAHHVQLPQLHRLAALPAPPVLTAAPPGLRVDQPGPDQGPVDPRP